MEYAIIGEKLGHSFSKEIYEPYFSMNYGVKELKPEEVDSFMKKKDFKGINVTIPYKQTVIPYLDEISDVAQKIGAVNVIVNDNGRLKGYNTDFSGLKANIENMGIDLQGKNVLILGNAKTINKVSLNKKPDTITYEEAKQRTETQVIINTTPVGMYPKIDGCLIDLDDFPALEGVFDAVYNPLCTKLVVAAKKRGIKACGGLYMLVSQAIFAVEKFKNEEVSQAIAKSIFKDIYKSKENIVLVGMPGSGKTTVGKLLAKKLGREFIDTDEEIVKKYGEISAIFEAQGESGFRKIEADTIKEIAAMQSKVIATGGGAVLKEENIDYLKQNGRVYFVDRPIEQIAVTSDRPLSQTREELKKRYDERYEIYLKCCDKRIVSDTTAENAVSSIEEDFYE